MASTQLAEARAIGYQPLVAELLVAFGRTFMTGTHPSELLIVEEEAMWTALAVGRDDLAPEASIGLLAAVGGFLARFDEARACGRARDHVPRARRETGTTSCARGSSSPKGCVESKQHHLQRALRAGRARGRPQGEDLASRPPLISRRASTTRQRCSPLSSTAPPTRSASTRALTTSSYGRARGRVGGGGLHAQQPRRALIALGRLAEALETLRRALAVWGAAGSVSLTRTSGIRWIGIGRATPRARLPEGCRRAPRARVARLRETGEADATPRRDALRARAGALGRGRRPCASPSLSRGRPATLQRAGGRRQGHRRRRLGWLG